MKSADNNRLTLEDIEAGRRLPTYEHVPANEIDPNNVMPEMCPSCPWREDGSGVKLTAWQTGALYSQIFTEANQLCHSPALSGKSETKICRGARNQQQEIFYRLGVIEEISDDAWAKALREIRRDGS